MTDFLSINVNDHTEKKNGLTYLSWAWAWAEVLKVDDKAVWSVMHFGDGITMVMPDATCFVGVTTTIRGVTRECLLPVMDHRNKAIPKPNAFDVNKAIMRALAKAIAMHGLGLYIYAGEDLPEDAPRQASNVKSLPDGGKPLSGAEDLIPEDEKPYLQELCDDLKELHGQQQPRSQIFDRYDVENLNDEQKKYLWSILPAPIKRLIKEEGEARRNAAKAA